MTELPAQTYTIAPLEALAVPALLDGASGTNRVLGRQSQIAAANDVDAVKA